MSDHFTQKFIVKLDYEKLNTIIRKEDEHLLELAGVERVGEDKYYKYISDNVILSRFRWLSTSEQGIKLLGMILDNIDNCLECVYFDDDGNGWEFNVLYELVEIHLKYNDLEEEVMEMAKKIEKMANRDKNVIFVEAEAKVRYYKEYFLRLYDRGKNSRKK